MITSFGPAFLAKGRPGSDLYLCLLPLPTEFNLRLLPALLQLLASEHRHRICYAYWFTSQFMQQDQVSQPSDTVPALKESLLDPEQAFFQKDRYHLGRQTASALPLCARHRP